VAWTTAALLGQHPMTADQAAAAASVLAAAGPAGDRVIVTLDGKFLPCPW
jgi:cyanate lyase